jgi:hypothetical protein
MDGPEPEPEIVKPRGQKRGPKRTAVQVAADMLYIEQAHINEGKTIMTIARELSSVRDYSLSWSMVAKDLRKLAERWKKENAVLVDHEKQRMLKELDVLREEVMAAWNRSKSDETRLSRGTTKGLGSESGGDGSGARETNAVVKVNRDGDATYISRLLDIQARRAKLLGLDAPTKIEASGPGGLPIPIMEVPLTDEAQDGILDRFFERRERRKNASATTDTPAPQDPA